MWTRFVSKFPIKKSVPWLSSTLCLAEVDEHDLGFSHGQLLRFFPVTFSSGGTFKLCFCDSELLADGKTCMQKQDFSVEVARFKVVLRML